MVQFKILNNNEKALKQKIPSNKYNSCHSEHVIKHYLTLYKQRN